MYAGGGEDCGYGRLFYTKHFGTVFHALLELHLFDSVARPITIKLQSLYFIQRRQVH